MPGAPSSIVTISAKNVGLAILLAILFGPLGMLYATIAGSITMFLVSVVVGVGTLGFGLLLTWPICVVWAAIAASCYNRELLNKRA